MEKQAPQNEILEMINNNLGGFNNLMGLKFTLIEPEHLEAELEISKIHTQPYGLVHGGVYCSMIETICSSGAALHVFDQGKGAVGLENSTSFLKATRSGKLICIAKPVVTGRRSHVWEAEVRSDEGVLVATGRVRLMIMEQGASLDGKKVEMEK